MKKLMHILVLSCLKATLLVEKQNSRPLSFMDKLQLSMHLKICSKCANYQKQSVLIESVLKSTSVTISSSSNFKLSDVAKIRIQKVINENLK